MFTNQSTNYTPTVITNLHSKFLELLKIFKSPAKAVLNRSLFKETIVHQFKDDVLKPISQQFGYDLEALLRREMGLKSFAVIGLSPFGNNVIKDELKLSRETFSS
jgi:hypothetical protein